MVTTVSSVSFSASTASESDTFEVRTPVDDVPTVRGTSARGGRVEAAGIDA